MQPTKFKFISPDRPPIDTPIVVFMTTKIRPPIDTPIVVFMTTKIRFFYNTLNMVFLYLSKSLDF